MQFAATYNAYIKTKILRICVKTKTQIHKEKYVTYMARSYLRTLTKLNKLFK
jgi:hypothetical protein